MKQSKNPTTWLVLGLLVIQSLGAQVKIWPHFFGGCWWLSDYSNAPFGSISPPDATAVDLMVDTRASTMRTGGIRYTVDKDNDGVAFPSKPSILDQNQIVPNPAGYVKLVDDIRAKGFEPHLTVPFDDRSKTRTIEEQALEAADIVRTVNKIHKRNVKVWIIGNEPNPTQGYWGTAAQVEQVRRYIRVFSMHMKNADPTIEVWGPEMESFNDGYFNSLLSSPSSGNSITGTITTNGPANTLPYVDKISYHHYGGFSTAFVSTSTVLPSTSNPYASMSRRQRHVEAGHNLAGSYAGHISDIVAQNGSRSKPLLGVINEFNMHDISVSTSSLSTPSQSLASSTDAGQITGDVYNANTFLAGQFITEQIAAMMGTDDGNGNCAYTNSNIWSIRESGKSYGLIHGSNNERKPTFWHFWLMSRYFNGTFYPNKKVYASVGSVERCFKAYACRSADYIAVMLLNQTQSGDAGDTKTHAGSAHTFTIDLYDAVGDARFAMGINQTHTIALNPSSTAMIFLSCDGSSVIGTYSLSDTWVAANLTATAPVLVSGSAPTLYSITTSGSICQESNSGAVLTAPFVCDWYLAPDLTNALTVSPSTTVAATLPGLYHAKYTNACSGNSVESWISKVVNETSLIISRVRESGIWCSVNTGVELEVENGNQTYTWAPQTALSFMNPPNTNIVDVLPLVNTVYSVSTGGSCVTTETFLAMAGSNTINNTTSMFTRDFIGDFGTGTHTNPVVFDSPDIWLSTTPNGTPIVFGTYVGDDVPHYFNIKVHNSTTLPSSGILTLYWSKFGVGQSWMGDWNNKTDKSIYSTTSNSNTPQDWITIADRVAMPLPITVSANSNSVFSVPWVIPNPSLFLDHSGGDLFHFCVVSTIETGCSAIPTSGYLQTLVMKSEKMSWKNFGVLTLSQLVAAPGYVRYFGIGSNSVAPINLKLRSENNGGSIELLEAGNMSIELSGSLYNNWTTEGANGYGISAIGNNKVAINSATAQIEDLIYEGDESATFSFLFTRQVELTDTFHVWIERYDEDPTMERDTMIGGLHLMIIPPECPVVNLTENYILLPPDCIGEMFVDDPEEDTEYNWFTASGSYVQTGTSCDAYATGNTFFVVQGYKNGCMISDTCVIEVTPGECGGRMARSAVNKSSVDDVEVDLLAISPNPANDELNVVYDVSGLTSPELVITNSIGQKVYLARMNSNRHTFRIDCSRFLAGMYQVSILSNNRVVKSKKVAIAR